MKLWIDMRRDGYPLRFEFYHGEDLIFRSEVSRMEALIFPTEDRFGFPPRGERLRGLDNTSAANWHTPRSPARSKLT